MGSPVNFLSGFKQQLCAPWQSKLSTFQNTKLVSLYSDDPLHKGKIKYIEKIFSNGKNYKHACSQQINITLYVRQTVHLLNKNIILLTPFSFRHLKMT
jgi:hypothetical protein